VSYEKRVTLTIDIRNSLRKQFVTSVTDLLNGHAEIVLLPEEM
jgi:hypothetical protein